MTVDTRPGTTPMLKKGDRGNEVDECRHGLHEVEHGPDQGRSRIVPGRQDTDRDRDDDCDDRCDDDQCQSLH